MDIKRITTGLIGIPIILAILFMGTPFPFYFLIIAVMGICIYELDSMYKQKGIFLPPFLLYGTVLIFSITAVFCSEYIGLYVLCFCLFVISFIYFLVTVEDISVTFQKVTYFLLGATFIVLPLSHLILIRKLELLNNSYYLLFFILFIWIGDTAAYFSGRRFGKRKLAALVSPGKTVEGAFGQVLSSVLFTAFCGSFFNLNKSLPELLFMGLVLSVFALYSDMAESLLKRTFGVKDSGSIIPGHGGFLDRLDSFLFTSPLYYYFLLYL